MRQIDIMMDQRKREWEAEVRGLEQRLQAGEHELWSARRLGEAKLSILHQKIDLRAKLSTLQSKNVLLQDKLM
uniref:CEP63/Deup1 N-terminal domain-containing protein n=1 Tax=Gadus morhua TaxID=8049 RepID=A0A8C4ZVD2_GADMO